MKILSKYPNTTVVLSALIWGTFWIPLRYIDSGGEGSIWPILLSFLFVPLILIKFTINSLKNLISQNNIFFFLGNFFCALAIALYSESLLRGEIAKVIILFYLCPVWGTIFAKIFLDINFNFQRYVSLFLGILGLEVILGIDKGVFFPKSMVELIAVGAGISWALGLTFFYKSKTSLPIEKTALTGLMIPLFFFLLALVPGGRNITEISFIYLVLDDLLLWIILFSILFLIPSMFLIYINVKVLDPGRINILLMFEVIIGISTAALLTNEIIGLREVIGAIIIISAAIIDIVKIKI